MLAPKRLAFCAQNKQTSANQSGVKRQIQILSPIEIPPWICIKGALSS